MAGMIEKHAPTILTAVVIGLLSWVGVTVQSLSVESARLGVAMSNLEKQVIELSGELKEVGTIKPRITDTERRVTEIERRVERLENKR